MAQRLGALVALLEDLSSIPSNQMVALNYLQCDLAPSTALLADRQTEHCTHNK